MSKEELVAPQETDVAYPIEEDEFDGYNQGSLFEVMAKLKIPKDSKSMAMMLGKDELLTQKEYIVVCIDIEEVRALWPISEEEVLPICKTKHSRPGSLRIGGIGFARADMIVDDNEPYDDPDESMIAEGILKYECQKCRWNKFGSQAEWNNNKSGKGKACTDSRLVVFRLVERDAEGNLEANFNSPLCHVVAPPSSLSAVGSIFNFALARKIPYRFIVFKIENELHKEGNRSWGSLKITPHGFINPVQANELTEEHIRVR